MALSQVMESHVYIKKRKTPDTITFIHSGGMEIIPAALTEMI